MTDISKNVRALLCCAYAIRGRLTEDDVLFIRQEFPDYAEILINQNADMKAIRQPTPTNHQTRAIKISADNIARIVDAFNNGVK